MISILVALIIIGVVLYLIGMIPMDAWIKQVIRVLAILFVVLWILDLLVGWSGTGGPTMFPHLRR